MKQNNISWTSARLNLREFAFDDVLAIQNIAEKPGFNFVLLDKTDTRTGEKLIQKFVRENAETDPVSGLRRHYRLAVTRKESGILLGYIGLFNIDPAKHDCEMGFFIDPQYQGQGYAVEAAKTAINTAWQLLSLDSIYATVREDNKASRAVLGKIGFVYENIVANKYTDDIATRLVMRLNSPTLPSP